MRRNTLNFIVDAVSAAVMLGLVLTGWILRFTLPPRSGRGAMLWGLGRHDWGDVHFWLAVAAAAIVIVHLALHWGWVCTTVARCFRRSGAPGRAVRNISGAGALALLVAAFCLFAWIADAMVERPAGGQRPAGQSSSLGSPSGGSSGSGSGSTRS